MTKKGFITPLIIVVTLIALAAAIGGYMFLKYQKEKGISPSLLMLKSKCREDGKRFSEDMIKTYYGDHYIGTPQYVYNAKLDTCLYAHSYGGEPIIGVGKIYRHNAFIIDIYTNHPIIEYTETDGEQLGDVSKDDFNKKYKELFQTTTNFPFL